MRTLGVKGLNTDTGDDMIPCQLCYVAAFRMKYTIHGRSAKPVNLLGRQRNKLLHR